MKEKSWKISQKLCHKIILITVVSVTIIIITIICTSSVEVNHLSINNQFDFLGRNDECKNIVDATSAGSTVRSWTFIRLIRLTPLLPLSPL